MSQITPQPHTHEQRFDLARQCTDTLLSKQGGRVLAVGIYGSTAKGLDGPYSDLEMHCVLEDEEYAEYTECVLGPIKVSVDLLGRGTIAKKAAEVDEYWAMTQSEFANIYPTHDPEGFLSQLALVPFNQPEHKYRSTMRGLVVGYLYEYLAKAKGAVLSHHNAYLPWITVETANAASWLFGLDNRYLFTRSATMYAETLTLPGFPPGGRAVFDLVMTGNLSDPERNLAAIEELWSAILPWCEERGIEVVSTFETELGRVLQV